MSDVIKKVVRLNRDFRMDHAGGATLLQVNAQQLHIDHPTLISLDIIKPIQLRELCIAQPGPKQQHLLLRQTKGLSRIKGHLSKDGHGAVVHLDTTNFVAGADGAGLHIDMPVARIDAAWQDYTFAFEYPAAETAYSYWQRVSVLPASGLEQLQVLLAQATADDLIVLDFAQWPSHQPRDLSLTTAAELACINLRHIETMAVTGARALHVQGADENLHVIKSNAQRIQIERTPALERVENLEPTVSTQLLSIADTLAESLNVDLNLVELKLKRVKARHLKILHCQQLQVHSSPFIKDFLCDPLPMMDLSGAVSNSLLEHAQLALNETILRHNMADITDPHDPALVPLLKMVPLQIKGRDLYPAMLVLHKAFELGTPIEELWQLRNELNSNHLAHYKAGSNQRQRVFQNQSPENQNSAQWRWKVRGDGCVEVWRNDFMLWAAALNAGVEHALSLRKAVGQSIANHDYACLAAAYALQSKPQILTLPDWLQVLKQTLKIKKRRDYDVNLVDRKEGVQKRFVQSLLRYCKNLNDEADDGVVDSLRKLAIDYVLNCFDIDTVEYFAEPLFALHTTYMRAWCLQKSRQRDSLPNFLLEKKEPSHTRYLKLALAARPTQSVKPATTI